MLRSSDGLWYFLRLGNDGGIASAAVDQINSIPSVACKEYAVLTADDAQNYEVRLYTESGYTMLSVSQSPTLEAGVSSITLMDVDTLQDHACYVRVDAQSGIVAFAVEQ